MRYLVLLPHKIPHVRKNDRCRQSGLSLIEVIVAMLILGLIAGGILGGLVFARRITEASICQSVATNAIQGYLEQMRGLAWNTNFNGSLPSSPTAAKPSPGAAGFTIATATATGAPENTFSVVHKGTTYSYTLLTVSQGPSPTNLKSLTPSSTVAGAVDNDRYPVINASSDTKMKMTVWVWVEDKSATASSSGAQIKLVTMVYKWAVDTGSSQRSYIKSIQTMISSVPTV